MAVAFPREDRYSSADFVACWRLTGAYNLILSRDRDQVGASKAIANVVEPGGPQQLVQNSKEQADGPWQIVGGAKGLVIFTMQNPQTSLLQGLMHYVSSH